MTYTAFTPADLFNCCTDHREPNWGRFERLEIGGCCDESEVPGETLTVGGKSFDEAEFFTIYGRLPDGESEAITDEVDPMRAGDIAEVLSERSGLQLVITY